MAAVIHPEFTSTTRRPALRVVEGGRSAAARRRAATFRRRRVGAFVALTLMLAGLSTIADAAFGLLETTADRTPSAAVAAGDAPVAVHLVQPGETLWDIAAEVAPNRDPRAVVDELVELNGSASITPGQRLLLPA
jgi:hypothetical protein